MGQYRVSIRSASPDSSWIRRFLQEIAAHGGDIREIAFFGLFHEDLKRPFEEASRLNDKAKDEATHVVQLLLHPRHHKHYLRNLAGLQKAMLDDPRVILVYDLQDIPENILHRREELFINLAGVQGVLEDLRKCLPKERLILERSAAVEKLADVVRFPT